jgi:hypothetical protein
MKTKARKWLKRLWKRPMLKAEAWDYMTCKAMSDETFAELMLKIRKDALKVGGW